MSPQPSVQPRPMGGFNQGLGDFSSEHLDENSMQATMQQKATNELAASATPAGGAGQPDPSSLLGGNLAGSDSGEGNLPGIRPPAEPPRALGTLTEELVTRPVHDIWQGLLSLFDLNAMLGLKPSQEDPASLAKKKQMLQRFNALTDEEKGVAQQRYKELMEKRKQEEQEAQAKKQQAEQEKAQSMVVPRSPQKGPVGPAGSGKKRAEMKLEQDRKTLGSPASVN